MMWNLWFGLAAAALEEPGWRCSSHDRAAPCFDVSTCRRGAARRKGIVSVFDAYGDTSATLKSFVGHREKLAKAARRAGVDAIFVLPRRDLQVVEFPGADVERMRRAGVEIRYADWIVPPNISTGIKIESGGCCGARWRAGRSASWPTRGASGSRRRRAWPQRAAARRRRCAGGSKGQRSQP